MKHQATMRMHLYPERRIRARTLTESMFLRLKVAHNLVELACKTNDRDENRS